MYFLAVSAMDPDGVTEVGRVTGTVRQVARELCRQLYVLGGFPTPGDGLCPLSPDDPVCARVDPAKTVVCHTAGHTAISGCAVGARYDDMIVLTHNLPFTPHLSRANLLAGIRGEFVHAQRRPIVTPQRVATREATNV